MGWRRTASRRYEKEVRELVDIAEDGSFRLNMEYFAYHYGLQMTTERFHRLLRRPAAAQPEAPLEQRHKDIAASIQVVTEDVMLQDGAVICIERPGSPNLCLAGGVALNCVANGRIAREAPFRNLFVQPAAGDAGGALGRRRLHPAQRARHPRNYVMRHAFLGPAYETDEIRAFLTVKGAIVRGAGARRAARSHRAARSPISRSSGGSRGAWSSGRARSAARSILADAAQSREPGHA